MVWICAGGQALPALRVVPLALAAERETVSLTAAAHALGLSREQFRRFLLNMEYGHTCPVCLRAHQHYYLCPKPGGELRAHLRQANRTIIAIFAIRAKEKA